MVSGLGAFEAFRPILMGWLHGQSRDTFEKKLTKAAPSIAARMSKEGWRKLGNRHAIRAVLYWQCKAIVKSGTLADLWRDAVDDDIVAEVEGQVPPEMSDEQFVGMVQEALVRKVF